MFDRVVGLDEVPDGYRAMNEREAIKVMVKPCALEDNRNGHLVELRKKFLHDSTGPHNARSAVDRGSNSDRGLGIRGSSAAPKRVIGLAPEPVA